MQPLTNPPVIQVQDLNYKAYPAPEISINDRILVTVFTACDYIPGISLISNLFLLAISPNKDHPETYTHWEWFVAEHQDRSTCLAVLSIFLPGISNLFFVIYDVAHHKYNDETYVLSELERSSSEIQYASLSQRSNPKVILKAMQKQHQGGVHDAITYAAPSLRYDPNFIKIAMKVDGDASYLVSEYEDEEGFANAMKSATNVARVYNTAKKEFRESLTDANLALAKGATLNDVLPYCHDRTLISKALKASWTVEEILLAMTSQSKKDFNTSIRGLEHNARLRSITSGNNRESFLNNLKQNPFMQFENEEAPHKTSVDMLEATIDGILYQYNEHIRG